jgi:nitrate/TMAO reductase-like tetraheme cytochrome c subunit
MKQSFTGLHKNCIDCHKNVHGTQFEENGVTNCNKCHGFESWDNANFNHSNTKFPLEGGHVSVDCVKCHKEVTEIEGKQVRKYKIAKFECIDCHQ